MTLVISDIDLDRHVQSWTAWSNSHRCTEEARSLRDLICFSAEGLVPVKCTAFTKKIELVYAVFFALSSSRVHPGKESK